MPKLQDWLKRGEKRPKQKKRIRPMSKKRARENREYLKRRKAFLETKRICYAGPFLDHWGVPHDCHIAAKDVHHRAGRLGGNFLDESTWLPVCRPCHDWIHSHPKEARQLGLLAP